MQANEAQSFIYILPTGAWAREEINCAIRAAAPKAAQLPNIFSMQEFIGKLHARLRPYRRLINDSEVSVLIELSIRELFAEGALRYYEERSAKGRTLPLPRGTFEELVAALATTRERGITPERMLKDIERKAKQSNSASEHTEIRRARDLYQIYLRYEEKLGTTLIDTYGQYLRLVREFGLLPDGTKAASGTDLRVIFREIFPETKDIFIETFVRFPKPARLIVNHLRSGAKVYYALDLEEKNPSLYGLQMDFQARQMAEGFMVLHTPEEKRSLTTPEEITARFRRKLFDRSFAGKRAGQLDAKGNVHYFTARNSRREIELLARKVKSILLAAPEEYDLSQICVAMYKQDSLSALVSEVFREYGIPTNSTERITLASAPIFVAVDSLFRLAEFRLSVREVGRLLHSPYFLIRRGPNEPIDAVNLSDVITEFRLASGSERWSDELAGHLDRLRSAPQFDDELDEAQRERSLSRLERALSDVVLLEDLIRRFLREVKPKEFLDLIRSILAEYEMKENLLRNSDSMIRAGALEADTRSYAALMEVLDEVEHLARSLGINEEPQKLEFFTERIRAAALKKRFAPRTEPGSGVIVTSFDQTAGLSFDHLFLIGLNDEVLPAIYSPSVFTLSEHDRTESEHLLSERYAFYQTLTTSREHLYLSWQSARSGERAEALPSVFVDAVLECVDASDITAELEDKSVIYSSGEFARYAGVLLRENVPSIDVSALSEAEKKWFDGALPRAADIFEKRKRTAFSEYSGYLDPAQLPNELSKILEGFRERIYSVSQLECYARCPFQYFSRYVLGLGETLQRGEEEGMEASERGVLLHKELHEMLAAISAKGKDFREMEYAEFVSYDPYGGKGREALLARPGASHPFWRIDLDTLYEPEGRKNVLEKFLDAEKANKAIETKPLLLEEEFTAVRITEPAPDDGSEARSFRIRGKIDRIDANDDRSFFIVTDYKTSRSVDINEIRSGKSLQLPLYLRVAEDLLRAHLGADIEGVGAFYHTLTGKEAGKKNAFVLKEYAEKVFEKIGKKRKGFIETKEELADIIETTIRFAADYIDGITRGEFPLAKKEDVETVCKYCPYKRACRLNEAMENGALRQ